MKLYNVFFQSQISQCGRKIMPTRGYELPVMRHMPPNSTSHPFYIYPHNEETPGCKATEKLEFDLSLTVLSTMYMVFGFLYTFFGKFCEILPMLWVWTKDISVSVIIKQNFNMFGSETVCGKSHLGCFLTVPIIQAIKTLI